MRHNHIICIIALTLSSSTANADFYVTGKITGTECWGIGIDVCSKKNIDAVKGSDGRMYTVNDRVKSVTKYNKDKNLCMIKTKDASLGVFSTCNG